MSTDSFLKKNAGPRRVVIDRIQPSVDGGLFPIKRASGDPVVVNAWIFADGHDEIAAVLEHRVQGAKEWQSAWIKPLPNDEWEGEFTAYEVGLHEYRIVAWVDTFSTWRNGYAKKAAESQLMEVELLIGADLVKSAVKRSKGADRNFLSDAAAILSDESLPVNERARVAQCTELLDKMRAYPDKKLQTISTAYPLSIERERAIYSAWYEFFPRSWSETPGRHGTFSDAERILPEIANMGFNVIYLPPIHPIGFIHRKGKNNALQAGKEDVGSPWAIGNDAGGHKSIHPELGTFEDFQHFVGRVSELGMEVALDIAFQCAPDHPYVKEHPQWFKWRPDGTVQYAENPPKKYQDILPFNFECDDWENLWDELKSVFFFWIQKGVKIFRVDNPHTKPLEFWHWVIMDVKKAHPDVIFLAEAFTRPKRKYRLAKAGFTHGYTYFTWRNDPKEMREYIEELTRTEVREYFWPNFWPNTPDILHEYIQKGGRAGSIVRLVLAATLSSNYGLYGPAYELLEKDPYPGKEEYIDNEKYELKDWNWDKPGNLKTIMALINKARRENPALHRTCNVQFVGIDNPAILAYLKTDPTRANQILTVTNFDYSWSQSGWLDLPLGDMGIGEDETYQVQDLLTDKIYEWRGRKAFVQLDPSGNNSHIFRISKRR
jgi:starch synthase (maltosyl-transferring)